MSGTSTCVSGARRILSSASRGGAERALLRINPLGAVALLELLAGATPAWVVAADVLDLRVDLGLRRDRGRDGAAAARVARRRRGGGAARGEDRFGAGERLVLVAHRAVAAVRARRLLQLVRGTVVWGHLGVEEERHDLLADRAVQLEEHHVALVAVLDERVLLGHAAEMDPLAHVVH